LALPKKDLRTERTHGEFPYRSRDRETVEKKNLKDLFSNVQRQAIGGRNKIDRAVNSAGANALNPGFCRSPSKKPRLLREVIVYGGVERAQDIHPMVINDQRAELPGRHHLLIPTTDLKLESMRPLL
jgi:hypothetical protein